MSPRTSQQRATWPGRLRLAAGFLLLATSLLLIPGYAAAKPAIVLEAYVGTKPDERPRYLQQLLATMDTSSGILSGASLRQQIEARHSRSSSSGADIAKLRAAVEEGGRLFIEGEFDAAIGKLEAAKASLLGEVALLASDQSLRGTLRRALLFLAHAYLRSNLGAKATERMAEVSRSFPDHDLAVMQLQYGPELVSLYRKVRSELQRQRRTTLLINTQPPGCAVFLNERYVGMSPARVDALYPGRYRIYVQHQELPGRVHELALSDGVRELQVHFELDRTLASERFVGLHFPDLGSQEQQAPALAAELGRALDARLVLLVGYRQTAAGKALIGSAISPLTGQVIRSAMLAVEPVPPSPAATQALGSFLLDGRDGSGLITPVANTRSRNESERGRFFSARVFKWVALGVAAGSLAAGITLLAVHGRGTCDAPAGVRCPERLDTQTPGAVLTGVGGLAAAGTGLLFYLDHRGSQAERAGRSAALLPWLSCGFGVAAALSF